MSASLNRFEVIGNLTRDVELRYAAKGTAVGKIGLAINKRMSATESKVVFIEVVVFGKTAENCSQYLKKGAPVFIEGELNMEEWDDKTTGQKRSKLSLTGNNVQFLSNRSDSSSAPAPAAARPQPKADLFSRPPAAPPTGDPAPPKDEDDVPF